MIDNAQELIVKTAKKLLYDLEGRGILVTIVVEDTTNPDLNKGLFVCTNLSPNDMTQKEYFQRLSEVINHGDG